MISFVQGTIEELEEDSAVISTFGIGFEVLVSSDTVQRLASIGLHNEVRLYTYMYIREDVMALYGFLKKDELELFKKLISVNGIGPKGGLSLLSALSADDLRFAILSGDSKTIARAPGIGKKTAERLVIDLRDKVSMSDSGEGSDIAALASMGGSDSDTAESSAASDAAEALTALGYARVDAVKAVRKAEKEGAADTESMLKAALKFLM